MNIYISCPIINIQSKYFFTLYDILNTKVTRSACLSGMQFFGYILKETKVNSKIPALDLCIVSIT